MKALSYAYVLSMFIISLGFTVLSAGLTGCQANNKKAAEKDLAEAKEDLREAQKDVNAAADRVATMEEYDQYKKETAIRIQKNNERIAELRVKLAKPGKALDEHYVVKINKLEQDNKDLKVRVDTYDTTQSNWEEFKREFNRDMDVLGNAIEDLFEDNKN
jgi:chromosome segregation ATPase